MNRLSIFFLFFSSAVFAQEKDFQIWSKIQLKHELNKQLTLTATEGFRLRENASLPSKLFTNFSLGYSPSKKFRLAAGVRFINVFELDQKTNFRFRGYLDLILKKKAKRTRIYYRGRLQHQEVSDYFEQYCRNKFSFSHNLRKTPLEPFFSTEIFYDINNVNIDKLRYTLGFSYPLSKNLELDFYQKIQREINSPKPKSLYILGFGLAYRL